MTQLFSSGNRVHHHLSSRNRGTVHSIDPDGDVNVCWDSSPDDVPFGYKPELLVLIPGTGQLPQEGDPLTGRKAFLTRALPDLRRIIKEAKEHGIDIAIDMAWEEDGQPRSLTMAAQPNRHQRD